MEQVKLTMAAARVNAGLTQEKLAEILGVTRVTVNKWERGGFAPSAKHRQAFCEAVGLPEEAIIMPA